MLDPKEITLTLQDGSEKTFILSKLPAVAGREIVTQYPVSNMPKVGEYQASEAVMLKLMAFVAVKQENGPLMLTTRALIDNHVGDWETLVQLEWQELQHNVSFFKNGKSLDFLESLKKKLPGLISQMLTDFSARSSPTVKPPSTS